MRYRSRSAGLLTPVMLAVCSNPRNVINVADSSGVVGRRSALAAAAYEVGAEHWWDLLYPAHALANGQWRVTVNQCGGSGPGAMFGRSRVIAPDGRVVAEAPAVTGGRGPGSASRRRATGQDRGRYARQR
jgi:hypothetical protein